MHWIFLLLAKSKSANGEKGAISSKVESEDDDKPPSKRIKVAHERSETVTSNFR